LYSQKIYLVRHGQTDYNLQGIVQGSGVDASLNDRGRAQALAFYETYRSIPFNRLYTSRLKRSKESVVSFVKDGIPCEEHKSLNEISWGTREGQHITPEEDAYYHRILMEWQEGKTSIPIEGGESPDEVAARQQPFINLIKSRPEDQTILICMHGRAMRILLCQLLNYPLRSMDMFEHANLGLYLIHYTGTQFIVDLYNNTDHLKEVNVIGKEPMLLGRG
jgi:broad specificity phosphatase PhoE